MNSLAVEQLFLLTVILGCASKPSLVAAESESNGWRGDIDWYKLASQLSPTASLIDASFQNYTSECLPELFQPNPTHHALIDQPSGLCLNRGFLGWQMAWPRPSDNGHLNQTFDSWYQDMGPPGYYGFGEPVQSYLGDETNPSLDLPPKVLFPVVASDVVAAIQFAKEHSFEISVKNSGHSFSGSSTKKNTLLLNMNKYTQYAPDGITDCDPALSNSAVASDLSNQACVLALARNKSSLIRVAGGENFDKAYRAVISANKAMEEGYKYHLVGGASGTVSPMGWTWQGGNAGTTGGRLYGKGVDQVLQVEMVLPNGQHVRFGPTEWEDASQEGFVVPRTTVVSGVCRSNPGEEDEEKWVWGECSEDFGIDFGDLWFAVNGGGGGTWGVVTSVYLQLHDILPFNWYPFGWGMEEECSPIAPSFKQFQARYFMAPALLNVTKEKSLACSSSDAGDVMCFGEDDVAQAWTKFLELNKSTDPIASSCLVKFADTVEDPPKSFPETIISFTASDDRFPGKLPDPGFSAVPNHFAHVLVPQSWIDSSEENIDILLQNLKIVASPYYAYGVDTASFSDQANSLSPAHREAAALVSLLGYEAADEANFWSNLFPEMFDISDKTKFPPVFGSNHAGVLTSGPLKADWTKPCPRDLTFEERRELCISSQEAIYGTELLNRLETIKMAVDPHFMFNCNGCIGNNLDLDKVPHSPNDESSSPTAAPLGLPTSESDEPSSASFAFTNAASISTATLFSYLFVLNY